MTIIAQRRKNVNRFCVFSLKKMNIFTDFVAFCVKDNERCDFICNANGKGQKILPNYRTNRRSPRLHKTAHERKAHFKTQVKRQKSAPKTDVKMPRKRQKHRQKNAQKRLKSGTKNQRKTGKNQSKIREKRAQNPP